MKYRAVKLCSLLLACVAASVSLAATPVDETVSAEADGLVTVELLTGDLTVTGWDRNQVSVQGEVEDDVEEVAVTGGPGRVEIVVEVPEGREGNLDIDADLEIRVPRGSRLAVNALSADVEIAEIAGDVSVEVVSGDVDVDGGAGEVTVQSASGDIKVSGPSARVQIQSVSGDVVVKGISGEAAIQNVSGDTTVRGKLAGADISAVSGDLRFDGDLTDGARVGIQSVSGSVELSVSADLSADFQITTFSGDIESDLGGRPERTGEPGPGKELSFTTGGGNARVEIQSFSGDVRIRLRK